MGTSQGNVSMSKIVQSKPQYSLKPVKTRSFSGLVCLGMFMSFVVGAGASHLFKFDNAIAVSTGPVAQGKSSSIVHLGSQERLAPTKGAGSSLRIKFSQCVGSIHINCVVDGDTFWIDGVKVRIADIDAPEVGDPRCAMEKALGERATSRLLQLVNAAPFEMKSWQGRDEDQYGRKLRVLLRNGRSLGDMLVSEGLARTWTGKRQRWC